METKFNFNSQICTTREQSKRLLALGLKKETADCTLFRRSKNAEWEISTDSYIDWVKEILPLELGYTHEDIIPAWSLHRLIEMMPYSVEMYNKDWCLQVSKGYVRYASIGREKSYIGFFQKPNTFDAIIDCIEWLIKEGYFPKEYLEE